ncbi:MULTISPECIES: carbon starvation protein A [unclassified Sporosarcina]|uniref:carbon starvation CstA family protein n=1 Tax=unclassified Sporosarcina TaxID=2647733 RepID=UPI000C171843|nr:MULTISPECIES: carbon starvation CstA family protein [unclassified Sporosarcina]PID00391.1 carbon starvation protein A [Sporosarcina sp. P29]PID06634.1 carbon starvation protein A [Sporosarcina sp. P30]PID09828.1 carbon starvation protein A [Sporosarcina sp. P31]PID13407.1 carbon starvation protein A [Sporosarcina sp. P32b]
MLTFLSSIVLLIIGYLTYSKVVEKAFVIDDARKTPAYTQADGMDYVPMSWWKGWLIQLLNIAGLGPIFGAIAGALYGPVAFIWIVFGSIFAGAVHDYFSGMLSLKHGGAQFPKIVGEYLGDVARRLINVISVVLMVLVAAAFTAGPAQLISSITPLSFIVSLILIFAYFVLAAILPINKIIGRLYPVFGVVLIVMAVGIGGALLFGPEKIPNLTLQNLHPGELPIWPLLMVTISCGAISGFHCTQSPIVSRTMKKESEGRKVFYGAMIAEGIIAMVWAAAGMTFFGGTAGLQGALAAGGPAGAVNEISSTLLGSFGGLLAILGVIILPITTGDTALRSARMIFTEATSKWLNPNKKWVILATTLLLGVPMFYLSTIDYSFLWRYVGGTNQLVAAVMLWTATSYLIREKRAHWIAGIPAMFMTAVVVTYWMYAPEGLHLDYAVSVGTGIVVSGAIGVYYVLKVIQSKQVPVIVSEQ